MIVASVDVIDVKQCGKIPSTTHIEDAYRFGTQLFLENRLLLRIILASLLYSSLTQLNFVAIISTLYPYLPNIETMIISSS